MEPIDLASNKFASLIADIAGYKDTVRTEADARLKIINPVLTNVLGWSMSDIFTEEQAGRGFIDYKLTVNSYARLILEAKKDERELGLTNRASGRAYKLDGPVFTSPAVKEGIEQGIRYCGQKTQNSRA